MKYRMELNIYKAGLQLTEICIQYNIYCIEQFVCLHYNINICIITFINKVIMINNNNANYTLLYNNILYFLFFAPIKCLLQIGI